MEGEANDSVRVPPPEGESAATLTAEPNMHRREQWEAIEAEAQAHPELQGA